MDATIQIRQNGMLTLPAKLRKEYGKKIGDTFQVFDIKGAFVLTRTKPLIPELAREIEKARLDAGLEINDLLKDLSAQRERYVVEKYNIRNEYPRDFS
jgi:bifunctional DNA-binding transcriptional regulator/antitoxin component of YhaV-PrlF toxin-antitoxin module